MRIGARGSDLAQWQAKWVAAQLKDAGIDSEIIIIETHGDRVLDRPLSELGVQGVFTKEIEEALLDNRIDLAVHSFKDMATLQPDGLALAAITEREDPADLLLINPDKLAESGSIPLEAGAIVGSSAIRRGSQLKALHAGVEVRDLRGNVPTRVEKLRAGEYDAIMLAAAGVRRLNLDLNGIHVLRLDPLSFIPSPAQGALAIQMRRDDAQFIEVHNTLHHDETAEAVTLERSLITEFGGGCSLPLGAYAFKSDEEWTMYAFWGEDVENPKWVNHSSSKSDELVSLVRKSVYGD